MAWKIEFTPDAVKQLEKIDKENAKRIGKFLRERVAPNPRQQGKALKGQQREFWRFRVGDFRILAHLEDERVVVLVVKFISLFCEGFTLISSCGDCVAGR